MIQKVQKYIQEKHFIEEGDNVLVCVSGGADSVCLLCALSELYPVQPKNNDKVNLAAVHVNHHLRETAKRDEEFTKNLCQRLHIPVIVKDVYPEDYAREQGLSAEEAARILRYKAFQEAAKELFPGNAPKIAVAHHMEDNAETILFHMFRGTGIRGLGGIPPKRDAIIRPLLGISRKEIDDYLIEKEISYCVDETNLTDDYTRNKIRHHILPMVEAEIHEGAIRRMNEMAEGMIAAEDFIMTQVQEARKQYVIAESQDAVMGQRATISLEAKGLHPYLLQRLILHQICLVAGTAKDISKVHVEDICQLFSMQVGKQIHLPYGCEAIRDYQGVVLKKQTAKNKKSIDDCISVVVPGTTDLESLFQDYSGEKFVSCTKWMEGQIQTRIRESIEFSENIHDSYPTDEYTKWFDYDKIKGSLHLRTREQGDYLEISSDGATQKLKSYFVNEKIPKEQREMIPLLAEGSHILWVLGHRVSCGYYVTRETKRILEVTFVPNNK